VCTGRAGPHEPPLALPPLRISRASLQRYSLPLAAPTTARGAPDAPDRAPGAAPPARRREGLLLRLSVAMPGGREVCGIGEIAPLPGALLWQPNNTQACRKGKAL